MVYADRGFRGDGRLGVEGNAEAGGADHEKIVGAIADRHCLGGSEIALDEELVEPAQFGVLAEDRLRDGAGQHIALELQRVCQELIETDAPGEVLGKEGEAARHQRGVCAVRLHGVDEGAAAGGKGDALATHRFDGGAAQALEQGDAQTEGAFELDLAAHRLCGDFGNLRLDPERIGKLVDAFLLDHGRIHVGNEQLLAPVGERHAGHVDRQVADRLAGDLLSVGVGTRLDDVAGDVAFKPVDLAADLVVDRSDQIGGQHWLGGIGDEAEDGDCGLPCGRVVSAGAAKRAVLIAGPTASGKSALALRRAVETGGIIVNADALQVYDGLAVLTARPTADDVAKAEHRLYGVVPPERRFSTGEWARAAQEVIGEAAGRTLIFAGGTGLYLEALTNGFADVPEVPSAVVEEVEAEVAGLDREGRGRLIAARDPEIAGRLKSPDPQRVIRALAVLKATGRSLARFQDEAQAGLLEGYDIERVVVDPGRDELRRRIALRFEAMLDQGAVEEVRDLLARGLDLSLPAMKAIGVREIGDCLAGRISREEAIERAVTATRQYAKRQRTWLRNRMADWPRVGAAA